MPCRKYPTYCVGRIDNSGREQGLPLCECYILYDLCAGDRLGMQGGRLVTERRMVTDMWLFDLNTLVGRKLEQFADEDLPASRYFHSADTCA